MKRGQRKGGGTGFQEGAAVEHWNSHHFLRGLGHLSAHGRDLEAPKKVKPSCEGDMFNSSLKMRSCERMSF
jgi:hypothetical protein